MKKIKQILTLAIMLSAFSVAAQSTLTGVVKDASMQEPLPGATIVEKGTSNGVSTGTTLIYGVKHFLNVPLKQFKTAVLVNRNHKKYPVKADFKGISLSTSLKEHVSVIFGDNDSKVILE